MNLTELLDQAAARWPKKSAIVEDASVSYAELVQRVHTMAAQLAVSGIGPGERVGLALPNSIQYVVLTYAVWRAGAVVVPIPSECPAEEVTEICMGINLGALIGLKPSEQSIQLAPDCYLTKLHPAQPADNHELNLAFIRFTSGTTSARKGVALSHETIRDRISSANKAFGISCQDTVMWCLPMAHHFLITIVLYLAEGATVVLSGHVLALPFLEDTNKHRGTILYAAPFHFAMLARNTSSAQIPTVRLAVSTTCALPHNVSQDFLKRFDRPLVQALGIIELGLVSLNTADPRGRWDSVGRIAGDFKVRITNPDENGCGDVAVSGPGVFDAYVTPWLTRERVLRDGWFFTGDIGRIDDEGFLFLVSRKTAVINLAGRKVFPEEIESVLNRHPGVRESRVYGTPHPHLGEVVEAELVLDAPDASLDSIKAFCKEHLASYKIPMRFSIVSALPRTAVTGKIRRAASVA
jgi:long-chain acyl-CoA synthetase